MTLTITITMDNAAFDPEPGPEVARILRKLADQLEDNVEKVSALRDINGNKVGEVEVG